MSKYQWGVIIISDIIIIITMVKYRWGAMIIIISDYYHGQVPVRSDEAMDLVERAPGSQSDTVVDTEKMPERRVSNKMLFFTFWENAWK